MAYEVSRRSFLKGAAALAAATAASGLLTACGGGKNDDGFTMGDAKVYFGKMSYGINEDTKTYFIIPDVKILAYRDDLKSVKFEKLFSAKVGDEPLTLENKSSSTDKLKKGSAKDYLPKLTTKNSSLYEAVKSGTKTLDLTITLSGSKMVFSMNLPEDKVTVTVKNG